MHHATISSIQPELSSLRSWFGQDRNELNSSITEAADSLRQSHELTLIDEIASIDKMSAQSSILNPKAIYNLHQELELACDTFKKEIFSNDIGVSIYIAPDIPVIYSDTNSLRIQSLRVNVLNHILANAVHHTPSGGRIAIRAVKHGVNAIAILVSDSGPFYQPVRQGLIINQPSIIDTPMHDSHIRSMADLHNALICAQAHNGTLSVVEQPGSPGATVKIEFPLYGSCIH